MLALVRIKLGTGIDFRAVFHYIWQAAFEILAAHAGVTSLKNKARFARAGEASVLENGRAVPVN